MSAVMQEPTEKTSAELAAAGGPPDALRAAPGSGAGAPPPGEPGPDGVDAAAKAEAARIEQAARDKVKAQREAEEAARRADEEAFGAAAETLATPSERLVASRERMRQWMQDAHGRHGGRRRRTAAADGSEPPSWVDRLRDAPGIGVVVDALASWWTHHPLRPAASLAGGLVSDRIAPVVRRHPLPVIAGAFLVGVLLMRWRPWRVLTRPALYAGAGSHLLGRLLHAVPLERLLAAVGALAGLAGAAAAPPPPPATDPEVEARLDTDPDEAQPPPGATAAPATASAAGRAPDEAAPPARPADASPGEAAPVPQASAEARTVVP